MATVCIAVDRVALVTRPGLLRWVIDRVQGDHVELSVGKLNGHAYLLKVDVDGESDQAAEEQLGELMLDLRLLGLRPRFVAAPDGLA